MPRRLTTEEFIEKARNVHGDKYSYDKTNYINALTKITITCPKHGFFNQKPNRHLQGRGCVKCGGTSLGTTDEFIRKARLVHGNTYNYDRVNYVSSTKKVMVTCAVHGGFEQTPNGHLSGRGCDKCLGVSRLTTEEFIRKSREIHGDTYDYLRTVYVRSSDRVTITCREHGDFHQIADNHLQAHGCPVCANNKVKSLRMFIDHAREVHGDRYSYDHAIYVSSHKKITVTCREHGNFEQTPANHLQGCGCPKCASHGFNPDKQAFMYFLIDTETYSRVKIGVSNTPDKRFEILKRDTPFDIQRIDLFETPPEITLQIEKFCHSQLESCGMQGFSGATEWSKFDGAKLEALREFTKSCGGVRV